MKRPDDTRATRGDGTLDDPGLLALDQRVDAAWESDDEDGVWLERLAVEEGLAEEALGLRRLQCGIASLRVSVPASFADQVMARVADERPAWRRHGQSSPLAWLAAAAVLVGALAVTAMLAAGADVGSGPLATVADLLTASVAAGAGLLGASWRGVGTIAASWLQTSPETFALAALLLVAAPAWFVLRAARARSAASRRR